MPEFLSPSSLETSNQSRQPMRIANSSLQYGSPEKSLKTAVRYLLQLASVSYALVGQANLEAYETRSVTVFGFLNTDTSTFHAVAIQLLS